MSETERVEGSIIRSLANSYGGGGWLDMCHWREKGGEREWSSLWAMPPVAVSQVSSGVECYAVGLLNGKAVGSETYLGFPSE